MRPFRFGAVTTPAVALLVAACAHAPAPAPSPTSTKAPPPTAVNPANIKRVVRELPPGYEATTAIPSGASPQVIWSLGPDAWDTKVRPPQCGVLADPGHGRDQAAQGVSASGSGGIVDAVVVALPAPGARPDDVVAACGRWTMTAGHSTASVHLTDAPRIDGAQTLGMVADVKSSVESGTEIDSRTYTFIAYLGNFYAFTTLTTDPGSVVPALPPQFAADLLVKTVSTLRS
ncbi:hypothetical protein A5692_08525 [Mycobacterium sp. E342]|uniref:DUF5642 family protein n=1 Tax=Mycobacterium sp. E342 TaxID=1834147 RepID=UPI0007FF5027|nr:DUF5642 family protein [Mycobacterium sp. E342]OBH39171.1 hypothetical protein A5692_08525 [Mycobacterium sp. E342]